MPVPPVVQHLTGDRLHLQHGPIDLVLKAWGDPAAQLAACRAAVDRFGTLLDELVSEVAELRRPIADRPCVAGPVARRMVAACTPLADHFLTPMAAVAGAVADEVLRTMLDAAPDLTRAYVNDGGDIAVHVAPGQTLTLAIAGDYARGISPALNGQLMVGHGDGIGGIATSGARGRSFSLGIADSVTVLAASAAAADAAATLVANAVDADHPGIERSRAGELDPDSDLGDRLVTVAVPALDAATVEAALGRGLRRAEQLLAQGLILGAALMLQGRTITTDWLPMLVHQPAAAAIARTAGIGPATAMTDREGVT